MPERTDLAGGSLNSSDRLVVELVEPPDTLRLPQDNAPQQAAQHQIEQARR
jgi:hypothetical protein